jgi:uncharacterized membrane protein HdeD (DUF308 family)
MRRHWSWLLLLGIAEGVAGVIAIAMPLIGTLVSTFAYGWILLISGVLYGARALRMRGWRGLARHSLLALAYIVIGICPEGGRVPRFGPSACCLA